MTLCLLTRSEDHRIRQKQLCPEHMNYIQKLTQSCWFSFLSNLPGRFSTEPSKTLQNLFKKTMTENKWYWCPPHRTRDVCEPRQLSTRDNIRREVGSVYKLETFKPGEFLEFRPHELHDPTTPWFRLFPSSNLTECNKH